VIDELPWLAEQDELFDGALQTAWDRLLSRRPVLLLLLGSDIHMMERLTAYDRPFFGRADNMVLGPLNPADVADALGLDAADAIDAHLITGGLPGVLTSWPHSMPPLEFLETECGDPAAPLFSVPDAGGTAGSIPRSTSSEPTAGPLRSASISSGRSSGSAAHSTCGISRRSGTARLRYPASRRRPAWPSSRSPASQVSTPPSCGGRPTSSRHGRHPRSCSPRSTPRRHHAGAWSVTLNERHARPGLSDESAAGPFMPS